MCMRNNKTVHKYAQQLDFLTLYVQWLKYIGIKIMQAHYINPLSLHLRLNGCLCPSEEVSLLLLFNHLIVSTTQKLKMKKQSPHQSQDYCLVAIDDTIAGDIDQLYPVLQQTI